MARTINPRHLTNINNYLMDGDFEKFKDIYNDMHLNWNNHYCHQKMCLYPFNPVHDILSIAIRNRCSNINIYKYIFSKEYINENTIYKSKDDFKLANIDWNLALSIDRTHIQSDAGLECYLYLNRKLKFDLRSIQHFCSYQPLNYLKQLLEADLSIYFMLKKNINTYTQFPLVNNMIIQIEQEKANMFLKTYQNNYLLNPYRTKNIKLESELIQLKELNTGLVQLISELEINNKMIHEENIKLTLPKNILNVLGLL
jgi:hypothetical protein